MARLVHQGSQFAAQSATGQRSDLLPIVGGVVTAMPSAATAIAGW